MKILTAFAAVLSINVASAELVVYEATATVRGVFDPYEILWYSTTTGDTFRFRLTVDNSTLPKLPVGEEPSSFYPQATRDLSVWINDMPLSLAAFVPTPGAVSVLDNHSNYAGGPLFDSFGAQINISSAEGFMLFSVGFSDADALMLSSKVMPRAVDHSLADTYRIYFDYLELARDHLKEASPSFELTSFTILTAADLLQRLRTASEGVGPGKSLANKVELAQTYYAVPDLVSTCAVLADYVAHTAHKKVPAAQGAALADDANLIMGALACH